MAIKYTTQVRTNQAQQIIDDIGNGAKLRIYTGTRPVDANTAISTQTVLVELVGADPFGTASNGQVNATAFASAFASASGVATFFRLFKADGSTVIFDGDIGLNSGDMALDNTNIAVGQEIIFNGFTLTIGNA